MIDNMVEILKEDATDSLLDAAIDSDEELSAMNDEENVDNMDPTDVEHNDIDALVNTDPDEYTGDVYHTYGYNIIPSDDEDIDDEPYDGDDVTAEEIASVAASLHDDSDDDFFESEAMSDL